ncbi:MAG: membrane integrity-associated transporter subunit PqiC [Alphaproteobacteria bacterium]|nr:membrane integrity-associated transporter subunit PqiC [Alphaproteobacteria bacterium]
MMKKISLLICASVLSGCSLLTQDEPLPLYTLKSGPIEPFQIFPDSLAVEMPVSETSLDTERMALTPAPYERDYLAGGQWPERLPKILQEVLLQSLSERWGGGHVSRTGTGLEMKYLLQTDVQDFSVYHLNTASPEVQQKIAFKIINLRERKVVAGQTFYMKEKVCISSMKGIVESFNKGLHSLLQQAMPWIEGEILKESALNARNDKLGR